MIAAGRRSTVLIAPERNFRNADGVAERVAAGEFAGFLLLEWIPLSLRPAAELARASSLAFAVALAACAAHQALPDDPAGVPVDDAAALRVQMLMCSNYLLVNRAIPQVTVQQV